MTDVPKRGLMATLAASFLAQPVLAEPLQPGMPLPAISLTDQHDKPIEVGRDIQKILVSRDMNSSKVVKEALATSGAATLASAHAVYISDISQMPSLVSAMFALPALRKLDYPVLLDRDGKATADFPFREGHVTVILTDGTDVAAIRVVATARELATVLTSS